MRDILQKPFFKKTYKKLHSSEKEVVDDAIKEIIKDPGIGELKKGDLAGVSVYKFKVNKQEKLLAYVFDEDSIMFLSIGSHENFYRDLKKNH